MHTSQGWWNGTLALRNLFVTNHTIVNQWFTEEGRFLLLITVYSVFSWQHWDVKWIDIVFSNESQFCLDIYDVPQGTLEKEDNFWCRLEEIWSPNDTPGMLWEVKTHQNPIFQQNNSRFHIKRVYCEYFKYSNVTYHSIKYSLPSTDFGGYSASNRSGMEGYMYLRSKLTTSIGRFQRE